MGKEPGGTQKNVKGPGKRGRKEAGSGTEQAWWKGREVRTRDTCTRKKEQESGSVETGRDCIRRLLQIVRVFWLGIESNYQESGRLHRVGEGDGSGYATLTTVFRVSAFTIRTTHTYVYIYVYVYRCQL